MAQESYQYTRMKRVTHTISSDRINGKLLTKLSVVIDHFVIMCLSLYTKVIFPSLPPLLAPTAPSSVRHRIFLCLTRPLNSVVFASIKLNETNRSACIRNLFRWHHPWSRNHRFASFRLSRSLIWQQHAWIGERLSVCVCHYYCSGGFKVQFRTRNAWTLFAFISTIQLTASNTQPRANYWNKSSSWSSLLLPSLWSLSL